MRHLVSVSLLLMDTTKGTGSSSEEQYTDNTFQQTQEPECHPPGGGDTAKLKTFRMPCLWEAISPELVETTVVQFRYSLDSSQRGIPGTSVPFFVTFSLGTFWFWQK